MQGFFDGAYRVRTGDLRAASTTLFQACQLHYPKSLKNSFVFYSSKSIANSIYYVNMTVNPRNDFYKRMGVHFAVAIFLFFMII